MPQAPARWRTEQGGDDSYIFACPGLWVLQEELILFPGLWVKVKLYGLCKVHNSSMNKARLFSFKKTIRSGHWVPEESLVYKHLDGFACFLMPVTALKITAGFILYLICIGVGKLMIWLARQLDFKNKCLPCITFLCLNSYVNIKGRKFFMRLIIFRLGNNLVVLFLFSFFPSLINYY